MFSENLDVLNNSPIDLALDKIQKLGNHANGLSTEKTTNPNESYNESNERIAIFQDDHNSSLDNFDDFESLRPSKNIISTIVQIPVEPLANQFKADFSQFAEFEEENKEIQSPDDFEDEFDDFQDFTSAPTLPAQAIETFPQYVPQISNISERIESVLKTMFPQDVAPEDDFVVVTNLDYTSILIKQVDSALALNFQWSNSDTRKYLLESIGVDSRGISLHENRNPSMPRFAANLGDVPLEPMKTIKSDVTQVKSMATDKPKIMDVPAVEFRWSSSSCSENPLDGEFIQTLLCYF